MNNITVYLLCYNEADLIPQVNKWWDLKFPNCNIIMYDNQSTDGSRIVAEHLGWEVHTFRTEGMDDGVQSKIKNECWKDCKTEWAWVSDMDELPMFSEFELQEVPKNAALVRMFGYEMFDANPNILECHKGVYSKGYCKATLLRPDKVIETNYGAGAHQCEPIFKEGYYFLDEVENAADWTMDEPLCLAHMKWNNPTRAISRAMALSQRQSPNNIEHNWSFHYGLPLKDHLDYYHNGMMERIKLG